MEKIFNIASEFSQTPGARYRTDGKDSGQEFYENVLESLFRSCLEAGESLKIILDGTDGYATSFLDEAFGRLAETFGVKVVKEKLSFVSDEEPYLLEEINEYIENAHRS